MTSDPKKITVCGRRNHLSLTLLNESVETIHISTLPFKWLVEEILRRSPRVKTIEIPPCFENQLYRGARERLQQAGVNVVFGCRTTSDAKRTAKTWSTRWFWNKKHFLDTIDGEPKKRLETLLAMRWKPAEMMLKHFGIEQPRQTHKELSKEYGYKKASQGSAAIQAVLCYLNESFIAGTYLAPTINTIRRRVRAYEATLRVNTHHEQLATTFASLSSHGIVLAKNTPLKELANVQTLQQAKQNGRLDQLQTYWPDFYNVLMVRYGLHPDHQPCFKKIDEVATICGKRTRQRISQILISAFTKLRSHTNLEKKTTPCTSRSHPHYYERRRQ